MTDLIELLRDGYPKETWPDSLEAVRFYEAITDEAANEIERLQQMIKDRNYIIELKDELLAESQARDEKQLEMP